MTSPTLFDQKRNQMINPSDFAKMLQAENCIAYVGAGLSQKHVCSWVNLVQGLCDECGVTINPPLDAANIPELLQYADKAYEADKERFISFLRLTFPTSGDQAYPGVYTHLWKLPLTAIITTNFDHGLWFSCTNLTSEKNCQVYPHLKATTVSKGGVFYLHGKPKNEHFDPLDIVLGTRAFDRAYADHSPLVEFLKTVIQENGLVVFGAQLAEPPVKELFRKIQEIAERRETEYRVPRPRRFAVIPKIIHSPKNDLLQPDENERISQVSEHRFALQVEHMQAIGFEVFSYDVGANEDHNILYYFIEEMSQTRFASREAAVTFSQSMNL